MLIALTSSIWKDGAEEHMLVLRCCIEPLCGGEEQRD